MRQSLKGHMLPESADDFANLEEGKRLIFTQCRDCKAPFTPQNTRTRLGWMETQISGMCETCFDALFAGDGTDGSPQ